MNKPSKKTLADRNLSGTVRSKDAVNGQSTIMFLRSFINIFPAASLLSLIVCPAARNAEEFPGVKALMPSEVFISSGLNRLSPDELDALDNWLLEYTAGAGRLMQSNEAVQHARKDFEIRSRLARGFNGWSGNTVFYLENGQRWRQRLSGRYIYRGPPNPEVLITQNIFGFYKMVLVDDDRGVGVSLED